MPSDKIRAPRLEEAIDLYSTAVRALLANLGIRNAQEAQWAQGNTWAIIYGAYYDASAHYIKDIKEGAGVFDDFFALLHN